MKMKQENHEINSIMKEIDLIINNFGSLLPTPPEINEQIEKQNLKLENLDKEIQENTQILNTLLSHQNLGNNKDLLKQICLSLADSLEDICVNTIENGQIDVGIKLLSDYQQNLNEIVNNLTSQGIIQETTEEYNDRNQKFEQHQQKINSFLESKSN